jgi:hypothetical protein
MRLVVGFAMVACAGVLSSCGLLRRNVNVITGSGKLATEEREVSGFSAVVLAGEGDLIITQGAAEALTVEAEDNLLPLIRTQVRGGALVIDWDRPAAITSIRATQPIVFRLTVVDLDRLELAGSGTIRADALTTEDLALTLGGSGDVTLGHLEADDLDLNLTGSGDITLAGAIEDQQVLLSGSGSYTAGDLESQTARVELTGSGDITLWVREQLDVHISGSGSVSYFGQPTVGERRITGSGDINPMGDK